MRSLATARRLAPLLLALAPLAAGAADITSTETGDDPDEIINTADCQGTVKSDFTFTWAASATASAYGFYLSDQAFSTSNGNNSGCANEVVSGAKLVTLTTGSSTTRYPASNSVSAATLLSKLGLSCTDGTRTFIYLCVDYTTSSGTTNGVLGNVEVDFSTPAAPANVGVDANDSALNVHWDASTDTNDYGYRVIWNVTGDGTNVHNDTVTGSGTTSHRIEGLQNGTSYDVAVAILSKGRNPGTPSATITKAPAMVYDLWRTYKQDGGQEQGGCSTGAGGLLALLGVAPFAFRRGRRS